jgi:hypothetical protein
MNKIQKIGIVGGIILVVAAAILTVVGISEKNNLYKDNLAYEITMDAGMGAPTMDNFSAERSAISPKMMNLPAGESLDTSYAPDAAPSSADKKDIKNGNMTIKVDRVADAQEKISAIAKENGGDIFSTNISQTKNNIKSGQITVKVPVANFEKAYEAMKKTAALVLRESTSGVDVTEQYQDLETRIKNKQSEEEAYKNILTQAQKISDIIEVTEALARVRLEIESLQGQLKYLAAQTDLATISINLSEDQDITVTDSWRPLQIAKEAVNALVKLVQGFVSFLIVLVITFIPVAILYLLVILAVFFIARKIYRKFRKNKELQS